MMAHRPRPVLLAVAVLALAGAAQAGDRAGYNRSVNSVHQPIVSRTDYSYDVVADGAGLAPGEAQRLDGWLEGLGLGYGDSVTIAGAPGEGADGIGAVLSRYGMLVANTGAPIGAGRASPGSVRVIVSHAVARVEGCPDWTRGGMAEFEGASQSNYGCATAQNLAAEIADPQDLVRGVDAHRPADARLSVKAIGSYRDAVNTGKGGLKSESSKGGN